MMFTIVVIIFSVAWLIATTGIAIGFVVAFNKVHSPRVERYRSLGQIILVGSLIMSGLLGISCSGLMVGFIISAHPDFAQECLLLVLRYGIVIFIYVMARTYQKYSFKGKNHIIKCADCQRHFSADEEDVYCESCF